MTVDNQDTVEISFKQGLYSALPADMIPDGACKTLENALVTPYGYLQARNGFKSNLAPSSSYYNQKSQLFTFDNVLNDGPSVILNSLAAARFYAWRGSNLSTVGEFVLGQNSIYAFVMYNDRYYLSDDEGVKKITAWDWITPTATLALLTGSPTSLRKMVSFKDRMFGIQNTTGKVYFTDVATAGGYPETWNTTNNFFTVSSRRGFTKIYDMVPSGNRLLIFTSDGLYSLYVQGSPSQWVLSTVSEDVSINSYNAVVIKDGLFYFADRNGVRVTDGTSSIRSLSEPIRDIIEEQPPSGYAKFYDLTLLNDVLLLSVGFCEADTLEDVSSFIEVPSTTTRYYTPRFLAMPINTEKWSRFRVDPASGSTYLARLIIFTLIDRYQVTYWALGVESTRTDANPTATCSVRVFNYTGYKDEVNASSNPVRVTVESKELLSNNPIRLERALRGWVDTLCSTNVGAMTTSWTVDGTLESSKNTTVSDVTAAADGNNISQINADLFYRRAALTISLVFTSAATATDYIILKKAYVLQYLKRTEPDTQR